MKNKDLQSILKQYPPEMEIVTNNISYLLTNFTIKPETLKQFHIVYSNAKFDGRIDISKFTDDVLIIS